MNKIKAGSLLLILTLGYFLTDTVNLQAQNPLNEVLDFPKHYTPNAIYTDKQSNTFATIFAVSQKADHTQVFTFKEGKAKKYYKISDSISNTLFIKNNQLWAVANDAIQAYHLESGNIISSYKLPEHIQRVSAMTLDKQGNIFIADELGQQLFTYQDSSWKLIASGERLGNPTALLAYQDKIYIGTLTDLRVFDPKKGFVKMLTQNFKQVSKIEHDDLGYLLLLSKEDGKLVRVSLDGRKQQLPIQSQGTTDFCYDTDAGRLIIIKNQDKVMSIDYLKTINLKRDKWLKAKYEE